MTEPDPLVDAVTAAAYVTHLRGQHCAPGTIWSWATRGHIRRHGRGRYDIREIDTWTRRQLMQELTEWLRAQLDARERELDKDERVAQEARDGDSGQWFEGDGWNVYRAEDEARYDEHYEHEENRLVVYGNIQVQSEHIARWDPARVLREVATERAEIDAKRRILDWLAAASRIADAAEVWSIDAEAPARLLALPYAGRDGYLDAWRPEQQPDMPT